MCPELAAKLGYNGQKADLWALGVTLYRLVYRTLPFKSADPAELYRRIVNDTPPFPPGPVSAEETTLRQIILSLLSKDPELRPTAAQLAKNTWLSQTGEVFHPPTPAHIFA